MAYSSPGLRNPLLRRARPTAALTSWPQVIVDGHRGSGRSVQEVDPAIWDRGRSPR